MIHRKLASTSVCLAREVLGVWGVCVKTKKIIVMIIMKIVTIKTIVITIMIILIIMDTSIIYFKMLTNRTLLTEIARKSCDYDTS